MMQIVSNIQGIDMWKCILGCHDPYIKIYDHDIFYSKKVNMIVTVYCKRCYKRLTGMKYGNTEWWMG